MGSAGVQRVVFPFDDALPAARALWSLASSVLETEGTRQRVAQTGAEDFKGSYAQQFVSRMQTSAGNAQHVATELQTAATDIAEAWTDANFQQQTYAYYAMVKAKKDHESTLDHIGNWFTGDDLGSPPKQGAVPSGPGFEATAVPQAELSGWSWYLE